jgi:hypothetical protein
MIEVAALYDWNRQVTSPEWGHDASKDFLDSCRYHLQGASFTRRSADEGRFPAAESYPAARCRIHPQTIRRSNP